MKKYSLLLAFILCSLAWHSCTEDADLATDESLGTDVSVRSHENPSDPPTNLIYLTFADQAAFTREYTLLERLIQSRENEQLDDEACQDNPALDQYELGSRGYISSRRWYEEYECALLDQGLNPNKIVQSPFIDEVMATLLNPEGLVKIGSSLHFFDEFVHIEVLNGERSLLDDAKRDNLNNRNRNLVVITSKNTDCNASFDYELNNSTLNIFLNYTGDPFDQADESITWSIGNGMQNHKNETYVDHQFDNLQKYDICVTYTRRGIITDTMYSITQGMPYDSTYTIPGTDRDTTITIIPLIEIKTPFERETILCRDVACKTVDFENCTADFNAVVGIDNVVYFTDQSEVPYGTITSWEWQFGDGSPNSNLQNPTHEYPCDRTYTATLIIKSTHCKDGSESYSDDLDVTGINCCDANPQSSWKNKSYNEGTRQITYRYDMGTWAGDWWDQKLKGKIKNYRKNSNGNWKKHKANLAVEFDGSVYSNDEDECKCINDHGVEASPTTIHRTTHTFVDNLGGFTTSDDKIVRINEKDPIVIRYKVDGQTIVEQITTEEPGFFCESH